MLAGLGQRHAGEGPEARRLATMAQRSLVRQRESLTFARSSGPTREPATDLLFEAWAECSTENWDGEGAIAVPEDRLRSAIALVDALPLTFPAPDACGDRDGDFCLDWYRSPRRTVSVSIGAGGVLHWAALIGDDDPRGTWRFSPDAGDGVPKMLIYILRRIFA